MLIFALDLGSTNTKVVLYDETLQVLGKAAEPMHYLQVGDRVEFDPEALLDAIIALIVRAAEGHDLSGQTCLIAVTGQAESFILVDRTGRSVGQGISWMDARAEAESRELDSVFDGEAFSVTGQPTASPTWPASKLLWLSRHDPVGLSSADWILMMKDWVIWRMSGVLLGEVSTRAFSYLYDWRSMTPWSDMLSYCHAGHLRLAPVTDSGTIVDCAGPLLTRLPETSGWRVSVGGLDHFCAMLGLGGYRSGAICESAGTVLSLSALVANPQDPSPAVSWHRGLAAGDSVLFSASDAGGYNLTWWANRILDVDPRQLDLDQVVARNPSRDSWPLFLPYLTGVNAPDYDPRAKASFLELESFHGRDAVTAAVMEGVAHLLRRMVESLPLSNIQTLISSGGGTRSQRWTQLKADITGLPIDVPVEEEAACRGAAMLALVGAGRIPDLATAQERHPVSYRCTKPTGTRHDDRYQRFSRYISVLSEDTTPSRKPGNTL